MKKGFTLIELSIVLVIIGLVVGGILFGNDLIRAAEIRAQIKQIEQFNLAVTTFRTKYNGTPGDLKATAADELGFVARSGIDGHGDGDEIVESCDPIDTLIGCEMILFWSDLSAANLIPESLTLATDGYPNITTFEEAPGYFPRAKIVNDAIVATTTDQELSTHWLALSELVFATNVGAIADFSIPVPSAYALDSKMDDGHPTTGSVLVRGQGSAGSAFFFGSIGDDITGCVYNAEYNLLGEATIRCQQNFKMTGK